MHDTTSRGLLVAGLSANVLFLALALIDYARFDSDYMWPVFVGWAVLVLLIAILAVTGALSRMRREQASTPALARAVATLASRPPAPAPTPATVVHTHTPPTVVLPASRGESPLLFSDAGKGDGREGEGGGEGGSGGPFTYNGYTLYSRGVGLKNGGERTIWFFSKRTPSSGAPAAKPVGFHVGVNERTGLPFLKRGAGKDGEDLTPETAKALRPQCSALTEDGKQCRNSARSDSKYCASHFGYQPPAIAKAEAARKDTRARVRGAKDTLPSVRKRPSA